MPSETTVEISRLNLLNAPFVPLDDGQQAESISSPQLARLVTRYISDTPAGLLLSLRPGRWAKRLLDIAGAAILLLMLSPLMLALALLIRRDGGPALYRHQRVGREGTPFPCMKFRSMHVQSDRMLAELLARDADAAAEWAATRKLRSDPRVTPVGAFLRKTSLDELPQLFNVLRGQMSLVGPRPVVTAELAYYGSAAAHYLAVRPGLTGLWQVSGRSDTSYEHRVALDVAYVRDWNLRDDIAILLRTIPVVLLRRGAV